MLKKISVSDVRLGMHIHALDGAWIDHPFWKTRFILSDLDDLRKLQTSGLSGVVIDIDKGLDVAPAVRVDAISPNPPPALVMDALPQASAAHALEASLPPPPSQTIEGELAQASAICKRARVQMVEMFTDARLGKAVDAEACLPLVNDIADSVFRNPGALVSLARLKTQDDYTYLHSVAVCALMVSLGREMGQSEKMCREAGLAGLLHDLGKAAMPLEVLNKPGKLTVQEFEIMKLHPVRGHEMLLETRGASESAMDVCLHHHERIDGEGYPHGLHGERLTLLSRMGAVCDVYDAVTSDRPYKGGWNPADAIAQMASWMGHFDPAVFQAFVKSLGIYPVGSLIRLASGKLAVVIDQATGSLVAPRVKAFFSTKSNMPILPVVIDLSRSQDRIVGREDPKAWNFKDLDGLWAGDALPRR
jgi:HD-GYP domain-containing protein (c-di-GMP phosphodiesterase class II)